MAARRELAEEAGLLAEKMEVLIETFNTPGISDQHTTIYLATGSSPCPPKPMGVEEGFMTIETIALDDVDDARGRRHPGGRDDGPGALSGPGPPGRPAAP